MAANLRQATPADVPAMIDLARPTFEQFVPFGGSEEMVAHMLSGLAAYGGYVRIHEVEGELRGFLAGMIGPFRPWGEVKCALEMLFYIAPEHRRSRLAFMLISDFLGWGRAKGCDLAVVSANHLAGDPRVGRLYERLGFRPIETAYIKRID
jgi:GNAT superfamily N-acetyltransferase